MDTPTSPSSIAKLIGGRALYGLMSDGDAHIIDQLIEERTVNLSRNPLWPVFKPLLYRAFHYREAVRMADRIAAMGGREAFEHISGLLSLDIDVAGLENLPCKGSVIIAPNHPTGIADGVAMYDALRRLRGDLVFFANRDALRVAQGFRDVIIPVEWRAGEKSHAKSRDTLEMTARAFAAERAVVLFPAGRIAYWHEGHLTERPWQTSAVALARRFDTPIMPVHITARNSGLFYFLGKYSTELRDMTLFHELLNKKRFHFSIRFGKPIPPDALDGDATELTARLQEHAVHRLAADPEAAFDAPVTA